MGSLADSRDAVRILVVDDDPAARELAAQALRPEGFEVTAVASGREALEATRKTSFDLVICDIWMPEMDGLETTAAIRAQEQGTGRHLPIIALTSHAMQGDQERCLAAGVDVYVPKPVKPDTLYAAIDRLCNYEPS